MATPPPPPRSQTVKVRLPGTDAPPAPGWPPKVLVAIHDKLDFLITRDSVRFEPRLSLVERKTRDFQPRLTLLERRVRRLGIGRPSFGGWVGLLIVALSFGAGVLGAFIGRLLQ